MKRSHLLGAVCACVLTLIAPASQAVLLQDGDILSFTSVAGSQVTGTGAFGQAFDSASLDSFNGLIIGTAQPTTPGIDQAWATVGFEIPGAHFTTAAVTVIDGTQLDFSGWALDLGGEILAFGATQTVATYTFNGNDFRIDYHWDATDNDGNPLGEQVGATVYDLVLIGTVSSVPIPAAVWLFGSGLLGLVGIASRKKSA